MRRGHKFPREWYTRVRIVKGGAFTRDGRWVAGDGEGATIDVLLAPAGTREGGPEGPAQLTRDVIEIYADSVQLDLDSTSRVHVEAGPYKGVWEVEGTPAWWPKGTHARARRVSDRNANAGIRTE